MHSPWEIDFHNCSSGQPKMSCEKRRENGVDTEEGRKRTRLSHYLRRILCQTTKSVCTYSPSASTSPDKYYDRSTTTLTSLPAPQQAGPSPTPRNIPLIISKSYTLYGYAFFQPNDSQNDIDFDRGKKYEYLRSSRSR